MNYQDLNPLSLRSKMRRHTVCSLRDPGLKVTCDLSRDENTWKELHCCKDLDVQKPSESLISRLEKLEKTFIQERFNWKQEQERKDSYIQELQSKLLTLKRESLLIKAKAENEQILASALAMKAESSGLKYKFQQELTQKLTQDFKTIKSDLYNEIGALKTQVTLKEKELSEALERNDSLKEFQEDLEAQLHATLSITSKIMDERTNEMMTSLQENEMLLYNLEAQKMRCFALQEQVRLQIEKMIYVEDAIVIAERRDQEKFFNHREEGSDETGQEIKTHLQASENSKSYYGLNRKASINVDQNSLESYDKQVHYVADQLYLQYSKKHEKKIALLEEKFEQRLGVMSETLQNYKAKYKVLEEHLKIEQKEKKLLVDMLDKKCISE